MDLDMYSSPFFSPCSSFFFNSCTVTDTEKLLISHFPSSTAEDLGFRASLTNFLPKKPRCSPDQELISVRMSSVNSDSSGGNSAGRASRYESQKRRDWNTFRQYLRNHRPPLELARCSGAHVLEFLRYLDQFGKTKVHTAGCPFFGHPQPPAPCPCPLRQAWGSLDALVGRLRAAFEENGGQPEANPFAARAVRLYLREVRDSQAKARGITYEKKKRKRPPPPPPPQHQIATVAGVTAGQAVSYGVLRPDPADFNLMNSSYSHHQPPNGHTMMLTLDAAGGESSAAEAHPRGMIPLSVLH